MRGEKNPKVVPLDRNWWAAHGEAYRWLTICGTGLKRISSQILICVYRWVYRSVPLPQEERGKRRAAGFELPSSRGGGNTKKAFDGVPLCRPLHTPTPYPDFPNTSAQSSPGDQEKLPVCGSRHLGNDVQSPTHSPQPLITFRDAKSTSGEEMSGRQRALLGGVRCFCLGGSWVMWLRSVLVRRAVGRPEEVSVNKRRLLAPRCSRR